MSDCFQAFKRKLAFLHCVLKYTFTMIFLGAPIWVSIDCGKYHVWWPAICLGEDNNELKNFLMRRKGNISYVSIYLLLTFNCSEFLCETTHIMYFFKHNFKVLQM
jgi:hypothetical protein